MSEIINSVSEDYTAIINQDWAKRCTLCGKVVDDSEAMTFVESNMRLCRECAEEGEIRWE